jgi:hypothetical protein
MVGEAAHAGCIFKAPSSFTSMQVIKMPLDGLPRMIDRKEIIWRLTILTLHKKKRLERHKVVAKRYYLGLWKVERG